MFNHMKEERKKYFRIGVAVFLLYLCIDYWPSLIDFVQMIIGASMPLIIGSAIAYVVNILMSYYERFYFVKASNKYVVKSRRPICMLLAFVTLIAIIILVVSVVVPQFVACIQLLLAELPDFLADTVNLIKKNDVLPKDVIKNLEQIDWKSRIGEIFEVLTSGIGSVVDVAIDVVSSVFSGIVTALFSIIFSVYLLAGKERLGNQADRVMRRYIKKRWYEKINHVLTILNDCFHKFIVGQCMAAVILGLLCMFGMMVLQLPYATMIGALIALTALIPVAGAYIGAIVGAFMILTVSPIKALIFLIFLIILQQIEETLIYPRVVGSSIDLPGIWVLAAVTIGGGVMGILGMLIGVPIAATIYRLVRDDVNKVKTEENSPCTE